MSAALIADLCGACRDQDCECCDLHVWGGPCGCSCPVPEFARPQPIIIVLNEPYTPVPPRNYRQLTHCAKGHPFSKENLYVEDGGTTRRCLICRRASWRRYQYRKHQRRKGGTA